MRSDMLVVENLSKTFPGTRALTAVDLTIARGEVRALVGANGSGKSTLIKVLSGFHAPDEGAEISLGGVPLAHARHRMRFVHQDLGLVEQLGVADNLALRGDYARWRGGVISWRKQHRIARGILDRFGLDIDPRAPVSEATPVQRTMLAIAGALQGWDELDQGLLVLDEPTAVLPQHEVETLLRLVLELRDRGTTILYVSHRLDELFGLADSVTVFRGGEVVADLPITDTTPRELGGLIVGQDVEAKYRADVAPPDAPAPVLVVDGAIGRDLRGVSLAVGRGEIVGLAGLPGSGHEELLHAVCGVAETVTGGTVSLDGGTTRRLARQRAGGVPVVPADRLGQGVVGGFSVRENISLSSLGGMSRLGIVRQGHERDRSSRWLRELEVVAASDEAPIGGLSGGNQQKVVIGRCLHRGSSLLVLSEPTAGVDIGSRIAIYDLIAEQAKQGLAVLVTSTDVSDLRAMCTRVLVFRNGVVSQILTDPDITEESIMHAMEEPHDPAQLAPERRVAG